MYTKFFSWTAEHWKCWSGRSARYFSWSSIPLALYCLPVNILHNLYLGGYASATNIKLLKSLKVTHVLNAAFKQNYAYFPEVPVKFWCFKKLKSFKYKILNARDDLKQNMIKLFDEAHNFIDEGCNNGGGVLVHWYGLCNFWLTPKVFKVFHDLQLLSFPTLWENRTLLTRKLWCLC